MLGARLPELSLGRVLIVDSSIKIFRGGPLESRPTHCVMKALSHDESQVAGETLEYHKEGKVDGDLRLRTFCLVVVGNLRPAVKRGNLLVAALQNFYDQPHLYGCYNKCWILLLIRGRTTFPISTNLTNKALDL